MATEGVALNGQHAVGEVVLLARADTANKRLGDDGRGDVEVDGFEDGPAAFAGVDYVRFKTSEGGILFQSIRRKVEKPGTNHGAVLPDFGDLGQIEIEGFLGGEDGEALSVGLHHAVFNAIVNHLDEVARAG